MGTSSGSNSPLCSYHGDCCLRGDCIQCGRSIPQNLTIYLQIHCKGGPSKLELSCASAGDLKIDCRECTDGKRWGHSEPRGCDCYPPTCTHLGAEPSIAQSPATAAHSPCRLITVRVQTGPCHCSQPKNITLESCGTLRNFALPADDEVGTFTTPPPDSSRPERSRMNVSQSEKSATMLPVCKTAAIHVASTQEELVIPETPLWRPGERPPSRNTACNTAFYAKLGNTDMTVTNEPRARRHGRTWRRKCPYPDSSPRKLPSTRVNKSGSRAVLRHL